VFAGYPLGIVEGKRAGFDGHGDVAAQNFERSLRGVQSKRDGLGGLRGDARRERDEQHRQSERES